jgi:hypothetical protein
VLAGIRFPMDPFTLLIKPMVAAGLFVTKLLVAAGYVATNGADPASLPKATAETVRVAVVAEPSLQSMELELPNGELFELARTEAPTAPSSQRRLGRTTVPVTEASNRVTALLESTHGRTMHCDVTLGSPESAGSARCAVSVDERYDVTF